MAASLDVATLRANARAWSAHAGVPLRAVVKSDGYGWGLEAVVRALDGDVQGYCVIDLAEFERVRAVSKRPVAILGDVPPGRVAPTLAAGGIPNLTDLDAVEAAGDWARSNGRRARVRLGLRSAIAWSGIDADQVGIFATRLAGAELDVECWTHLTDPSLFALQRETFARAVAGLRAAGVSVVATDIDATAALASGVSAGVATVRIGVGLFGAHGLVPIPGVSCALRLRAEIVRTARSAGQLAGYGAARAPRSGTLLVVRCGYGDGFPRAVDPELGILFVGMQYTVLHRAAPVSEASIDLLTAESDLDAFATAARIATHEVVLRLGHAARLRSPSRK
jgi:alanine racemase